MKKILLISFAITVGALIAPCKAQNPYVSFDSLSSGMTSSGGKVLALTLLDSTPSSPLFAGGHFTVAGRVSTVNIAEWIYRVPFYSSGNPEGKWVPLGTGIDSDVCALTMFDSCLYAGGKFDTAGGIASYIARWDTASQKWDSLAGQLNGNVYALCVYHDALYVGGDFTLADGDTVNRIAMWTDSTWVNVGSGFDTGAVYALTVSNDTLYAGGSFIKSGAVTLNHIAKLSGSLWKPLGIGTNNTVYAMTDYISALYVGGAFTTAGGMSTPYLSYWDDYSAFTWDSYGTSYTVNDTVRALCQGAYPLAILDKRFSGNYFPGELLLVGGNFDTANGIPDKYFVADMFESDTVQLSGPVYALAAQGYAINYACGEFKGSEGYPFSVETLNNVSVLIFNGLSGVEDLSNESDIRVYPNPSNGEFNLIENGQLKMDNEQNTVEVYNMLGEEVCDETLRSAQGDNSINLSGQPNGVYLYRVISSNGGLVGEGKLVIER